MANTIRQWALVSSEWVFARIAWILRPVWLQRSLRRLGIGLPYRYAKYLYYTGVVDFKIGSVVRKMQSHNSPIEMTIFWKGVFCGREGAELRIWHRLCTHVNFVLDIGANTGVYSIVASTESHCDIHAFEPVPVVADMLHHNISLNEALNITAHQLVVSDEVGQTTLYIPTDGWVDVASIEPAFAERFVDAQGLRKMNVQTTTVDSFLAERECDAPVLIKIDVEGAEPQVLRGMKKSFGTQTPYVLLEILNATMFSEVQKLIPGTYTLFGVVQNAPYIKRVNQYERKIKNYLAVPTTQVDSVMEWLR